LFSGSDGRGRFVWRDFAVSTPQLFRARGSWTYTTAHGRQSKLTAYRLNLETVITHDLPSGGQFVFAAEADITVVGTCDIGLAMTTTSTQHEGTADRIDKSNYSSARDYAALQFELIRVRDDFILYRAHSSGGGSVLAVAVNTNAPSSQGAERLRRECGLTSELEPAWALRPITNILHDGRPTLLLEDPGGEPLDMLLVHAGRGGLGWPRALAIACELASAVSQMHRRGIIHRDIKPPNVFVGEETQVRLTGFGLATRLSRSLSGAIDVVVGTFAYMSPEQTGRLNRSIDTRSDLYSLGMTLYELFAGVLPFKAEDAIEWAHCHIARRPPPPSSYTEVLPHSIDAIVLKLLAKDPEDRYQTARGAENDLRRCMAEWHTNGRIDAFQLAQDDISERLFIPERLYGRGAATKSLLTAAQRVIAGGPSELVLVSGCAGIGKSSLVNELHRTIEPQRVLFAAGKFDQFKRDIPYATLAQAFGSLVRRLLTKNDGELARWRDALLAALGPNGKLMIGLIPELAIILGEQPAAPQVDLQSAQARFHLVFRALLRVFAKAEHPLVLFIDDMQWLDSATLELLERLVTDPELRHVLMIGAYRDDEVDEGHPLTRTLATVRHAQGAVCMVSLSPLLTGHLAELLADALGSDIRRVLPLAALVNEKTGGNPFFSIQFLKELADERLLKFESTSLTWVWEIPRIRDKEMTDNVAHLISLKLGRLSPDSQQVLGQLALLGNAADVATIALVRESSPDQTLAILQSAVDAGLVVCANEMFYFAHDHVQEAAYALVSSTERPASHLRVGRLLLSKTPTPDLDDRIFEIVSQFDRGLPAIVCASERERVAELYLIAGRRAKAASAYVSARSYFSKGRRLLGDDSWARLYHLTFEFELNQAECEIIAGELNLTEGRLVVLGQNAKRLTEKAGVVCLAVLLHFTTGRSQRAVEIAHDFLSSVGVAWTSQPTEVDVEREYEEMHHRLAKRPMETLIDLPEMSDPTIIATMAVLTELFPAAYAVDRYLMDLVLLRMINLSLEHGNCESSSVAYSALNMALGSHFADYKTAYSLGELARRLVDRRNADRYKARVYSCFAAFTMPWVKHLSLTSPLMTQAFQVGSSMGDMAFAAYNSRNHITHMLMSGAPLAQVQHEAELAIAFAKNVQLGIPAERFFGQLQLVRRMRGSDVNSSQDDDDWARRDIQGPPGLAMMACYHWVFRLEECYFAGDYPAALRAAEHVGGVRWAMRSSVEEAEYDFYAGLTNAAASYKATLQQLEACKEVLNAHYQRMVVWAQNGPENFGCRRALLGAELARLQGRQIEAQDLYEEAIRLARTNGFLQIEALASELAGEFHAARDLATIADAYLSNAYSCYERWGCLFKVRQLDFRYPNLRKRRSAIPSSSAVDLPIAHLDVQVVDMASRTLSSEMVLTTLLEKLMRLAVEHAGAERGVLLLLKGSELNVEALATTNEGEVEVQVISRRLIETEVPQSALQYVLRTQAPIILDDGVARGLDYGDEYLQRNKPRSVLCLPIFRQADVIGVLYLENSMTTRAFTSDRVAVLDFLASQAAIWLDNARLYSDLQRSEAWLSEAQHLSRTGSFYWRVELDTFDFSEQLFRICQIDSREPVTIEQFVNCIHPGDRSTFHEMMKSARITGAQLNFHFRLQMPDLSVKHVHLVAHGGGARADELKYIGAIQDETEQHSVQEALGKARSELAHVARITTLGVLTASIAHEVNQPLLGIVTNATTCLRMLAATPPNLDGARRTAQRSVRDGHRAADMIRRLRSLFGNSATTSEPVDINEATREVIALAASELQDNQVILQAHLASDLPMAWADRVQVQQVILNLILNASDAMREIFDRRRHLILNTLVAEVGWVRMDVTDAGVGFNDQSAKRLFEAFYTTKVGGMGMGLSISRSIIESHGGRVWATRNSDAPGATFSFVLPDEFEGVSSRAGAGSAITLSTDSPR